MLSLRVLPVALLPLFHRVQATKLPEQFAAAVVSANLNLTSKIPDNAYSNQGVVMCDSAPTGDVFVSNASTVHSLSDHAGNGVEDVMRFYFDHDSLSDVKTYKLYCNPSKSNVTKAIATAQVYAESSSNTRHPIQVLTSIDTGPKNAASESKYGFNFVITFEVFRTTGGCGTGLHVPVLLYTICSPNKNERVCWTADPSGIISLKPALPEPSNSQLFALFIRALYIDSSFKDGKTEVEKSNEDIVEDTETADSTKESKASVYVYVTDDQIAIYLDVNPLTGAEEYRLYCNPAANNTKLIAAAPDCDRMLEISTPIKNNAQLFWTTNADGIIALKPALAKLDNRQLFAIVMQPVMIDPSFKDIETEAQESHKEGLADINDTDPYAKEGQGFTPHTSGTAP
ncbi:hypothetical protein C8R44DRAFT_875344 [Mycena epipterygia]|nr:hypothetical protein C8R44DRAFT_875344 [Mycena epipterygia]